MAQTKAENEKINFIQEGIRALKEEMAKPNAQESRKGKKEKQVADYIVATQEQTKKKMI